jgi:hypothetical protein
MRWASLAFPPRSTESAHQPWPPATVVAAGPRSRPGGRRQLGRKSKGSERRDVDRSRAVAAPVSGAVETAAQHRSVLFCSVLFCSVLFCSVLFCSRRSLTDVASTLPAPPLGQAAGMADHGKRLEPIRAQGCSATSSLAGGMRDWLYGDN